MRKTFTFAALILFVSSGQAEAACWKLASGRIVVTGSKSSPPSKSAQLVSCSERSGNSSRTEEPRNEPVSTPRSRSNPAPQPSARIRPVPGTYISQEFNEAWSANTSKRHTGLDIPAKAGVSVVAVRSGTVVRIGQLGVDSNGVDWGAYAVVEGDDGVVNGYLHVNLSVGKGDRVSAGSQIGTVFRDHLHFNQCSVRAGCQHGAFPNGTYDEPLGNITNYYQRPAGY